MAGITNKDVPWLKEFWFDFFKLIKRYWEPEDADDEYWAEFDREATELARQYESDRFCEKTILAYAEYLEEKQMRKEKDRKKYI